MILNIIVDLTFFPITNIFTGNYKFSRFFNFFQKYLQKIHIDRKNVKSNQSQNYGQLWTSIYN